MSTSHTPGPWANSGGRILSESYVLVGAPIATVHKRKRGGQFDANTRLIAAAPRLLDALENLCRGLEWNIENHPTAMNESDSEALAEARTVIREATGEAP